MPDDRLPDERLPAHIEASALLRQVQAAGGFAAVLAKGEREAGTMIVVITAGGRDSRAYERMPRADGTRGWALAKTDSADDPGALPGWLDRRREQDPDVWIIELDIPQGERFIGL